MKQMAQQPPPPNRITSSPHDRMVQCYPFLQNFRLCAIVTDRNVQNLEIQFIQNNHVVDRTRIQCFHPILADLTEHQLTEDLGDREWFEGRLYGRRAEGTIEERGIAPEELFYSARSWTEGIAEQGLDAFVILGQIEQQGPRSTPISNPLLRFVARHDPAALDLFIQATRAQCVNEFGEEHTPSVVARLYPLVATGDREIIRRVREANFESSIALPGFLEDAMRRDPNFIHNHIQRTTQLCQNQADPAACINMRLRPLAERLGQTRCDNESFRQLATEVPSISIFNDSPRVAKCLTLTRRPDYHRLLFSGTPQVRKKVAEVIIKYPGMRGRFLDAVTAECARMPEGMPRDRCLRTNLNYLLRPIENYILPQTDIAPKLAAMNPPPDVFTIDAVRLPNFVRNYARYAQIFTEGLPDVRATIAADPVMASLPQYTPLIDDDEPMVRRAVARNPRAASVTGFHRLFLDDDVSVRESAARNPAAFNTAGYDDLFLDREIVVRRAVASTPEAATKASFNRLFADADPVVRSFAAINPRAVTLPDYARVFVDRVSQVRISAAYNPEAPTKDGYTALFTDANRDVRLATSINANSVRLDRFAVLFSDTDDAIRNTACQRLALYQSLHPNQSVNHQCN